MSLIFIEFKIYDCDRKIVVNICKIMNFFELSSGLCTIVMNSEERFIADHTYQQVITMINKHSYIKTLK